MTPAGPLTLWTGWDPRGGAKPASGADAFEELPRATGEDRYELLAVAGRGFRPPQFLSVLDLSPPGEEEVHDAEAAWSGSGALRPTWSLAYRQVAETVAKGPAPHAIYLLGVDPPEGASDAELVAFNDFYTDVHLVEVAERRHALRAVRFELERSLKPPYQGPPRFLAVYEVDEAGASNRRHVGPPYSSGPDVWQRHTTPWRLWYRTLTA